MSSSPAVQQPSQRKQRLEYLFAAFLQCACSTDVLNVSRVLEAWHAKSVGAPPRDADGSPSNLLRASFWDAGIKESARTELTDFILRALEQFSPIKIQTIARFVDACRHESGCETPAESFLVEMVYQHYERGGITPKSIEKQLDPDSPDGFMLNFTEFKQAHERYEEMYAQREYLPMANEPRNQG